MYLGEIEDDESDFDEDEIPDCSECGAPEGDHVGECSEAFGDCDVCGAPGTCHVHPCPQAPFDEPCEGCARWFGEHEADCPL